MLQTMLGQSLPLSDEKNLGGLTWRPSWRLRAPMLLRTKTSPTASMRNCRRRGNATVALAWRRIRPWFVPSNGRNFANLCAAAVNNNVEDAIQFGSGLVDGIVVTRAGKTGLEFTTLIVP